MHYVYIIRSQKDFTYYKGYSTDPLIRLLFHNNGASPYTSGKMPWQLVAVFTFDNKEEALKKEKKLKKYNTKSLEAFIKFSQNQLAKFLHGGLENC